MRPSNPRSLSMGAIHHEVSSSTPPKNKAVAFASPALEPLEESPAPSSPDPPRSQLRSKSVFDIRSSMVLESWDQLKKDHKRLCLSLDKRIALDKSTPRVPEWMGVVLSLTSGAFVIIQVGINTSLRDTMVPSALVTSAFSFLVGLGTIAVISLIHKFPKQLWMDFREVPWFAFTGGLLGATFVTASILLAPRLGLATFQLAVVAGQLISGIICDTAGFLHLSPSKPTPWRIANVCLVLAGTSLSAKWSSGDDIEKWELPVYLLLAGLAGSVFPIQACVNYELGQHVGTPIRAVVVNYLVGTIAMWILVVVEYFIKSDPLLELQSDDDLDYVWWVWTGGIFGAFLIAGITIGIPSLGAVRFTTMFISTQLVCAIIVDAAGFFGYTVVPLTAYGGRRLVGASLAMLSAVAFKYNPPQSWKWAREWPCTSWQCVDEELLISEDHFVALPRNSSFHVAINVNKFLEAIKASEANMESIQEMEEEGPKKPAVVTQSSTMSGTEPMEATRLSSLSIPEEGEFEV